MTWRSIPGWPRYEVSEKGGVRTSGGYCLTPVAKGVFQLWRSGKRIRVSAAALVALAFTTPKPDAPTSSPKPHKTWKTPEMREQQEAERPKRRCHDCGMPTHNYRCPACWEKVRGFAYAGESARDEYSVDLRWGWND